jgi:Gene product 88
MQKMTKAQAHSIHGGLTQTTKMPCQSYSLPIIACITGYKMREIAGSICADCYADKGNYRKYANNIEPAQHARLVSIDDLLWVDAMVVSIGDDAYFRWHDSGDIQSIEHLEKIAAVARATPNCMHWIPTREYGIVSAFMAQFDLPKNLIIRLSAMFIDKPVIVPASLKNIAGIAVSNVHSKTAIGTACNAPKQNGECRKCRACWNRKTAAVSYSVH